MLINVPVNTPFDGYILADTPIGLFSIFLNGSISPGIKPIVSNIPNLKTVFEATILDGFRVPMSIRGATIFYLVLVNTGKIPPVKSLATLKPDSLYVLLMAKKAIVVQ